MTVAFVLALAASQEPDRSGEPVLRQMLAAFGSAGNFRAELARYELDGPTDPGYEESFVAFDCQSAAVFRIHSTASMGDGNVVVSDGKTWLSDGLTTFPVSLADAPGKFDPARSDPRRGVGVLAWLLQGESNFDSLVKPGGAVKGIDGGVEFEAPFGKTRVWAVLGGKVPRLTKVEIEPGPATGRFGPTPFVRDDYVRWDYVAKFPAGTFSTEPPPGVPVQDARKKPGG